jgi:hypothetical protein
MKKLPLLLLLLVSASPAFSQRADEPVYVITWFLGDIVCEYAENGLKDQDIATIIKPYIVSGKFYFVSLALPVKNGDLKPGFEFALSESRDTLGVYEGTQKIFINSPETVVVSGFAEPGKITVTGVFSDEESFNKWAGTVKFAE